MGVDYEPFFWKNGNQFRIPVPIRALFSRFFQVQKCTFTVAFPACLLCFPWHPAGESHLGMRIAASRFLGTIDKTA